MRHNSQEFGPFSLKDTRAKVEAGIFQQSDHARIAGVDQREWKTLGAVLSAESLLEAAYTLRYRVCDVDGAIEVYNDIHSIHPQTQEAHFAQEQLRVIKRMTTSERLRLREQFVVGKLSRQFKEERAKAEAENLRREHEAGKQQKSSAADNARANATTLIIDCPACAAKLRLPTATGKLKVTCPNCKDKLEVRLMASGHVHVYQRVPDKPPRHSKAEDDPYVVLQVSPTATVQEIKSAFRKRMQEYHPNRVASLGVHLRALAEEQTKQINRAYDKLLDQQSLNIPR